MMALVSTGSASVHSTNHWLKILRNKKCIHTEHGQTFFFLVTPCTIQHNNYLHSIYISLSILRHLEMILKKK
jgi:hypothetical protein